MNSAPQSRIAAVRPLWAVEGGRINVGGAAFTVAERLPEVTIGGVAARVVHGSSDTLTAIVPPGLEGGRTAVRVEGVPGETAYVEIGVPLATGLHQVDNPVFDRDGNLYVTFSGARGEQTPVSIYMVRPHGSREPFASGLANPTSMAFDLAGRLHVSSRFEGSVHRVERDGSVMTAATDLGVACGIAFSREGELFVGDRSGSILRLRNGTVSLFASIPPSVAAFHLAFGPDDFLYVAAPTLSSCDAIYRVSPSGDVEVFAEGFGRPQGLAFDTDGHLYVADSLAGNSGVYRLEVSRPASKEQVVAGGGLLGMAFDPGGGLVLASSDTVYRLNVPTKGILFD